MLFENIWTHMSKTIHFRSNIYLKEKKTRFFSHVTWKEFNSKYC